MTVREKTRWDDDGRREGGSASRRRLAFTKGVGPMSHRYGQGEAISMGAEGCPARHESSRWRQDCHAVDIAADPPSDDSEHEGGFVDRPALPHSDARNARNRPTRCTRIHVRVHLSRATTTNGRRETVREKHIIALHWLWREGFYPGTVHVGVVRERSALARKAKRDFVRVCNRVRDSTREGGGRARKVR